MGIRLQKWGNSNGIRIPKNILKELKIKENDRLDITHEGEKIIITKKKDNPFSLAERIKDYKCKI